MNESADALQAGDLGYTLAGDLGSLGGVLSTHGTVQSRARGIRSIEEHNMGWRTDTCIVVMCYREALPPSKGDSLLSP